jgi:hypothetical protein
MARFKMYALRTNDVLQLYEWKDQIDLDPPYQRLSIWDQKKQQCFIDSVINGFDIPKLYFHQVSLASSETNKYKYAVIDGKQRLLSLWEFMSNRLPLAEDFVFFEDETIHAAGAKYEDLMTKFPRLRARFDGFDVPITVVQTDDIYFIDDLFARLNIQVPLSGPELRNALGGPLPFLIRKIGKHAFFTDSSRIRNDRLQHLDLAAKFLYLTRVNAIESTKRGALNDFVMEFRKYRDAGRPEASPEQLKALEARTVSILDKMKGFFTSKDSLLVSQGRATLLFHIFRIYNNAKLPLPFTRQMLEQFNDELTAARKKSQRMAGGSAEKLSTLEHTLLAFDVEKQSPNDAGALTRQYNHFRTYLSLTFNVKLLKLD